MIDWFSPYDAQRRVGSLIEISATEAKINLTKAGTGEQVWLLGNKIPIGEVNEFTTSQAQAILRFCFG